jgi:hypothetical protein
MFGTKREWTITDVNVKIPIDKKHYPYAPDEEHIGQLVKWEKAEPKRWGKIFAENPTKEKI